MKTKSKKIKRKIKGFTIVEVLIVLAIAGLIMAMVFLAVPQLQASQRDSQRRTYARQVYASMQEYYSTTGRYPICDSTQSSSPCDASVTAGAQSFLKNYMPVGTDPTTGQAYNSASILPGAGEVHNASLTAYLVYDAHSVVHNTIPSVGQMYIVSSHWCYSSKPDTGPASDSIASTFYLTGSPLDLGKFAILIGLEHGQFICVDNYSPN